MNIKTRSMWITTALITLFFITSTLFLNYFHLPFVADDYRTLADVYLDRIQSPTGFGMFARAPVACLLTWVGIKAGLWEVYPGILFSFSFLAHFMGIYLLVQYIIKRIDKRTDRFDNASIGILPETSYDGVLLASTFIASLYSNNYEIHFWHGLTTHTIGILLFALSLRIENLKGKILVQVLPLLIYETFFLFYFGWILLELAIYFHDKETAVSKVTSNLSNNSLIEKNRIFLCICLSLLFAFFIKLGLKPFVNEAGRIPALTFDIQQVLSNSKSVFRTLFLLHHYKASWPLTAVFWSWILFFIIVVYKTNRQTAYWVIITTFIAIASALPLSLINYNAQRSYYGPSIFFIAAIAIGLGQVEWKKLAYLGVPLLLIFGFANSHIVHVKIENQNRLNQVIEKARITKLTSCNESGDSCNLSLQNPSKNLIPDWILPELMWISFYEYELAKMFPGKQFQVNIDPNL